MGIRHTSSFSRWFAGSKAIGSRGCPLMVYHGTVHVFAAFDTPKADPCSDLGAGFYFTNRADDADANYHGNGGDLTGKIKDVACRRMHEDGYDDEEEPWRLEEYMKDVAAETKAHDGATIPVFLRLLNPVVIGGANETWLAGDKRSESGVFYDFLQHIREDNGESGRYLADELSEAFGVHGGLYGHILAAAQKGQASLFIGHTAEVLRRALAKCGFDGFIDHSVGQKFPGLFRKMDRRRKQVAHYMVFEPTQIKSAIGNCGAFSLSTPDLCG